MKRKALAVILSIGMMATLAACGSTGAESAASSAASSAAEEAESAVEEAASAAESAAEEAESAVEEAASAAESAAEEAESATEEAESTAEEAEAAAEEEAEPAAEEAGGDIVIGATWQDLSNEYIMQLHDVADDYVKGMEGVTLIHGDGAGDASNQIAQVENFITQGVDAIILNPYDKDGCIPCAKKAKEAGIPIVGICTQLSDMSDLTSYVGSDDVNAGMLETQAIMDAIGGKGNVAVILGPMGISAEIQRLEGIDKVLADYPDVKKVYEQTANWSRDEAMSLMENWIQTGEQIDAVIAENDEMALGAYNALKAANIDIPVVGIDAIPDALQSVKNGGLLATILQNSTSQSQTAVDVAIKLAKGEEVEDWYDVPFEPVTADNIDDYLK